VIETVLVIPEAPPSLNSTARSPWPYRKAKDHWTKMLAVAIENAAMAPCRYVMAEGLVTFGDKRKRDQGNFRFMLEKALGDALVHMGVLEDDDWDSYEFGHLARAYDRGIYATRLLLLPDGP
jgi:hypothetical protein